MVFDSSKFPRLLFFGTISKKKGAKIMSQQEFIETLLQASEDIKALVEEILKESQSQPECERERSYTVHRD